MKKLLIAVLLCLCPGAVFSHPGKTDFRGGHQCLKECREWGLFYKEYHLHDKDGKPIRLSKKKIPPRPVSPALDSSPAETVALETAPVTSVITNTVTEYRYINAVIEGNTLSPNPLLWILVVLLLLLLIMIKKKSQRSR